MQPRFPLEPFPLIGNPILQQSGPAVAMHMNRDGALGQARLGQALLHQLAEAILIERLLFDPVGNLQVAVLNRVQQQLLKRAAEMELSRFRQ